MCACVFVSVCVLLLFDFLVLINLFAALLSHLLSLLLLLAMKKNSLFVSVCGAGNGKKIVVEYFDLNSFDLIIFSFI